MIDALIDALFDLWVKNFQPTFDKIWLSVAFWRLLSLVMGTLALMCILFRKKLVDFALRKEAA